MSKDALYKDKPPRRRDGTRGSHQASHGEDTRSLGDSTAFHGVSVIGKKAINSHAQSKSGTSQAAQLLANQVRLLPEASGEAVSAMSGVTAIPDITDAKLTSQIRCF